MKFKRTLAGLGIAAVLASGIAYAGPPLVNPASVKPQMVLFTAYLWLIQCGGACGGQRPPPR